MTNIGPPCGDTTCGTRAHTVALRETLKNRRGSSETFDFAKDGEETLKTFLDVNLGTLSHREHLRSLSLAKFSVRLALTVSVQTLLCLLFFLFYNLRRPQSRGDGEGWPNLPGATLALTIIGSALTFLLTFALGWAFQRWVRAREHMVQMMSTLKELAIMLDAAHPHAHDAMAPLRRACLWFGSCVVIYLNRPHGEAEPLWRGYVECTGAIKMCVTEHADDGAPSAREVAKLHVEGDIINVLKAHATLSRELNAFRDPSGLEGPALVVAYNMTNTLLETFYRLSEFKIAHMPRLLRALLMILTYSYTCFVFPVLFPYTIVMSLKDHAVKRELLINPEPGWSGVFVPIFLISSMLVLFYFNLLYTIQAELEDPFGND